MGDALALLALVAFAASFAVKVHIATEAFRISIGRGLACLLAPYYVIHFLLKKSTAERKALWLGVWVGLLAVGYALLIAAITLV